MYRLAVLVKTGLRIVTIVFVTMFTITLKLYKQIMYRIVTTNTDDVKTYPIKNLTHLAYEVLPVFYERVKYAAHKGPVHTACNLYRFIKPFTLGGDENSCRVHL